MTGPIVVVASPDPGSEGGQAGVESTRRGRLAKPLPAERTWVPDREAMLAALRVVLDLPAQLPSPACGGER
jgi:hypothetical protein